MLMLFSKSITSNIPTPLNLSLDLWSTSIREGVIIRHAKLAECTTLIMEVNCMTYSQTFCSANKPNDLEPLTFLPALNGLAVPSKL